MLFFMFVVYSLCISNHVLHLTFHTGNFSWKFWLRVSLMFIRDGS